MDYAPFLAAYPPSVCAEVARFVRFSALVGVALEPFQRLVISEFFDGRRELICLLPRGNGKTTLFALVALYVMLTVKRGEVYVAASVAKQAKILWEEARRLALVHPDIARKVKFRHNYLACDETGGSITILASDNKGKNHGIVGGRLFLVDELHAHLNSDSYDAFRTSLGKRADAQMVVISTAGLKKEGVLYELRAGALKLPLVKTEGGFTYTRSADRKVSMLEWALPQDSDPTHLTAAMLKAVNPASFVTVEFLAEQLCAPGLKRFKTAVLHGNLWAQGDRCWLPVGAWGGCAEIAAYIPLGSPVWLGVDVAVRQDPSAVVMLWRREDGRVVVKSRIWHPPEEGFRLSVIEDYIAGLAEEYAIQAVAYDPWNFQRSSEFLEDHGLVAAEYAMKPHVRVPASEALFEAVTGKLIVHDGEDEELAVHVHNGIARFLTGGSAWLIDKDRDGSPIDALIALSIAYKAETDNSGHDFSALNDAIKRVGIVF